MIRKQPSSKSTYSDPRAAMASAAAATPGRRKFLAGGAALTPFIVTLASRPALGGAVNPCTYSGMHSGNASVVLDIQCNGLTSEYWMTSPYSWDYASQYGGPYEPGPLYPGRQPGDVGAYDVATLPELLAMVQNGQLTEQEKDAYLLELATSPGTPVNFAFGFALAVDNSLTMMQAMHNYQGQLLCEASAGLLNACKFGPNYGYTGSEFCQMVQSRYMSDPVDLLNDLLEMNNRG